MTEAKHKVERLEMICNHNRKRPPTEDRGKQHGLTSHSTNRSQPQRYAGLKVELFLTRLQQELCSQSRQASMKKQ